MGAQVEIFKIYLYNKDSDSLLYIEISKSTQIQIEVPSDALGLLQSKKQLASIPAKKKKERKKKHASFAAALKAVFRLIEKRAKDGFRELRFDAIEQNQRLEKGKLFWECSDCGTRKAFRYGTIGKEGKLTIELRPHDFCLLTMEKDIRSKKKKGYEEAAFKSYRGRFNSPLANYLTRFKSMVFELMKHPSIEVTFCHTPAPASFVEIEAAQRFLIAQQHPGLSEDILCFYSQSNGLQLQWKLLEPDDYPESMGRTASHGSVNILPIQELFSNRVQRGSIGQDDLSQHYGFDEFIEDDCVTLDMSDPNASKIWIYDEESHPLDLEFASYLELLLKMRGFLRWQWYTKGTETADTTTRDFNITMKKLFNDFQELQSI
jgi:predicted DNA-binding WGR domain protein